MGFFYRPVTPPNMLIKRERLLTLGLYLSVNMVDWKRIFFVYKLVERTILSSIMRMFFSDITSS